MLLKWADLMRCVSVPTDEMLIKLGVPKRRGISTELLGLRR
ncbi:MAG: hypothetical protein ACLUEK_09740 [Oscillospiraceae bacterium]